MPVVADKRQMYGLYDRGAFGNRLKTWPSLDAYFADDYDGLVVMRYKGASGGAWCAYGVERHDVDRVAARWESEGADRSRIALNELAPDGLLVFQGEVMRSTGYLSLRYSTVPKPMRLALAERQAHADGAVAVSLLREHLDPSSFDDLMDILDAYPDSVVEFSVWSRDVGDCRGRNTVFWEVRNY